MAAEIDPDGQWGVRVEQHGDWAQKGKAPARGGDDLREEAEWYYRHNLKNPIDEQHELVREYVERSGRRTDAHSVVQNRLKQVESFLRLLTKIPDGYYGV